MALHETALHEAYVMQSYVRRRPACNNLLLTACLLGPATACLLATVCLFAACFSPAVPDPRSFVRRTPAENEA